MEALVSVYFHTHPRDVPVLLQDAHHQHLQPSEQQHLFVGVRKNLHEGGGGYLHPGKQVEHDGSQHHHWYGARCGATCFCGSG